VTASLKRAVDAIVKATDPDKIILFGSRANGRPQPQSDYDLLVMKEGIQSRRKFAQRIYRLLYGTGLATDVIVETPRRFEQLKSNPYLVYSEIARHGRVIYEKPLPRRRVARKSKKQPRKSKSGKVF